MMTSVRPMLLFCMCTYCVCVCVCRSTVLLIMLYAVSMELLGILHSRYSEMAKSALTIMDPDQHVSEGGEESRRK